MQRSGKALFILVVLLLVGSMIGYIAPTSSAIGGYYGIPYWAEYSIKNTDRVVSQPIWQITKDKSSSSVCWEDYCPNPRFALYDCKCNNNKNQCTWEDDVVLDKETMLVWERVPIEEIQALTITNYWQCAVDHCFDMDLACRKGWRLPTVEELLTLVDPNECKPALPECNPFCIGCDDVFWTATTNNVISAYVVKFDHGCIDTVLKNDSTPKAWCVRGGQGVTAF